MDGKHPTRGPQSGMSYGWLWPGLPQAWDGGRWLGLAMVVVAANRRWSARRWDEQHRDKAEDLFPQALTEYLQGNWFPAEQTCRDLIRRRSDDVDARLLLATLLRHTERRTEARAELDALARFDGAAKWTLEIAHERRLLDEAERQTTEETTIPADPIIRRAA